MFMGTGELIYFDEFTSNIQQMLEELRAEDLPQAMADAGELGELAKIEADNRGWTVERTIEHEGGLTKVTVNVLDRGDDEDEDAEGDE